MIWMRIAIAVLAGFLFAIVASEFTLRPATLLVESDRVRDPETGVMTNWFIFVVQWPVAIFTAVIGGVVTAVVSGKAGRERAIRGLIGFMIVVGLTVGAAALLGGPGLDSRPSSDVEVSTAALVPPIPPVWNVVVLPFVGALGVLLGGRLVTRAAAGFSPESDDAPGA